MAGCAFFAQIVLTDMMTDIVIWTILSIVISLGFAFAFVVLLPRSAAYHSAGDFNGKVIAKVESASTQLGMRTENVVGVRILQFTKVDTGRTDESLLGLSRGGAQIRKCGDAFNKALELLVRLASLQVLDRTTTIFLLFF